MSGHQQLAVVLAREVRRQEPNRRQVQRSVLQHLENHRELPGRPACLDPVVPPMLGQVKDLRAVRKERWAPGASVQPTGIELREVGDERGGCLPRASRETIHFDSELLV